MQIKDHPFFIEGPAGRLEALFTDVNSQRLAVICHPHPLYQGTMHNKVVTTLAKTMTELNISSVRFNYRGVGKSEGTYGNVTGELEDCMAVLNWLKHKYPEVAAYWLLGFSFGAYIAAKTAETWPTHQLVTIAPAVTHETGYQNLQVRCPWLLVAAENDELMPITEVRAYAEHPPSPLTFIEIKNASHFFHGQLMELKEVLIKALQ